MRSRDNSVIEVIAIREGLFCLPENFMDLQDIQHMINECNH
jgi:hypothetical protein